jgi:SAM-dependent methyltransferase
MVKHNSHLTAITRRTLPVPVRWLLQQGNAIKGHVLDYGCGKCAEINNRTIARLHCVESMTNYDPHFEPIDLSFKSTFDTILCTYVLCTLPESEESQILHTLRHHLRPDGMAFISVRHDKPKQGHGVSSRGTFQRWVELPYLRILHKTSQFRTFILTKNSVLP